MEKKDICLAAIAFLGWLWAIIQFFISRSNQRKDRLMDKKFEAYSTYMKKSDELMNNFRTTEPSLPYGIDADLLKKLTSEDAEQRSNALIQFNERVIDIVQKASEPLMILRHELNNLKIICSQELLMLIEEYGLLAIEFNNESQKVLSSISIKDSNNTIEQLKPLANNERWKRFETLNKDIIKQMRNELEAS